MRDRERGRPYRLGILASHVIQYQASFYRALTETPGLDVEVLFCSRHGAEEYWDVGFGTPVRWDVSILDGYRWRFLRNVSPRPDQATFFGLVNPQVVACVREFDAILVHGWMRCTNWLAMLAAFAWRVPVLMRTETKLLTPQTGAKAWARGRMLRWLFRRVAAFPAIGSHNAEFYAAFGVPRARIAVAPYAVDNTLFFRSSATLLGERAGLKAEHAVPTDIPMILYCGKLLDGKRPIDLLEAFAAVSSDNSCSLVFVGDGALMADLRRRVDQFGLTNVRFAGFRNQSELPRFYAAADIFVLPSAQETWGLVVNEAMCFGLPVVVSDRVGAARDLVRHEGNGFVFTAGDVPALSKHLRWLVKHERERERMGEASRQRIQGWSQQAAARGIVACLDAVVGAGGGPERSDAR